MYVIGRHVNGITLNPIEYVLDDDNKEIVFTTKESALEKVGYESEEEAEKYGIFLREYANCVECKHPLIEPFPEIIEDKIYCAECGTKEETESLPQKIGSLEQTINDTFEPYEKAHLVKKLFLDMFRASDGVIDEALSADDCTEIFMGILKGGSDLNYENLRKLESEYDRGAEDFVILPHVKEQEELPYNYIK